MKEQMFKWKGEKEMKSKKTAILAKPEAILCTDHGRMYNTCAIPEKSVSMKSLWEGMYDALLPVK